MADKSALIITPCEGAVRIQIVLDGKRGDWMEFPTAALAWEAVRLLREKTTEVFGPDRRQN